MDKFKVVNGCLILLIVSTVFLFLPAQLSLAQSQLPGFPQDMSTTFKLPEGFVLQKDNMYGSGNEHSGDVMLAVGNHANGSRIEVSYSSYALVENSQMPEFKDFLVQNWPAVGKGRIINHELRTIEGVNWAYIETELDDSVTEAERFNITAVCPFNGSPVKVMFFSKLSDKDFLRESANVMLADFLKSPKPESEEKKVTLPLVFTEDELTPEQLEYYKKNFVTREKIHIALSENADFKEGLELFNQGQFEQAIAKFTKALEVSPKDEKVLFYRGNAYFNIGYVQEALADYTKIIEVNPNTNSDVYGNRGYIYMKQGDAEKALADFNQALELNPDNLQVYGNRGNLYLSQQNFEKAISDYSQEIKRDPESARVYPNRAAAYFYKGEYEKSRDDVSKAQSIGLPVDPNLINALKEKIQ